MMRSPEAAKVIISYKKDQYQNAIDHMEQLGQIKAELAEAMSAKEECERLTLEIMEREERFRVEIESLKRERKMYKKHVEIKMSELQANIDQQTKSREEMKKDLNEVRTKLFKKFDKKFEELKNEYEETIRKIRIEHNMKIEKLRNNINW